MIKSEIVVDILLVEDNPSDAELTLRVLKKNNLANNLFVLPDGAEALDFIFCRGLYIHRQNQPQPKVVFLDLKLPKVDGLEVLKQIKSDERAKTIPVVIVTSSQEEKDLVQSYELGANSYIVKPVDFDNFSRVLTDLGFYWLLLNKVPTHI